MGHIVSYRIDDPTENRRHEVVAETLADAHRMGLNFYMENRRDVCVQLDGGHRMDFIEFQNAHRTAKFGDDA